MFLPIKDDIPTASIPLVTIGLIVANGLVFFHQITIEKNTVEPYLKKNEALHFILNVKVEEQVHG